MGRRENYVWSFSIERADPLPTIGVGVAHVGEVSMVKNFVATLNWHSYNGKDNGGGLHEEINEVQSRDLTSSMMQFPQFTSSCSSDCA